MRPQNFMGGDAPRRAQGGLLQYIVGLWRILSVKDQDRPYLRLWLFISAGDESALRAFGEVTCLQEYFLMDMPYVDKRL